jgi:hypothetical protein
MFVSQENTNARSRRNKVRADARAHGQSYESSLLYSEGDDHSGNMTGGAPRVESKRNAELAPQSMDRVSRKNPVISCENT